MDIGQCKDYRQGYPPGTRLAARLAGYTIVTAYQVWSGSIMSPILIIRCICDRVTAKKSMCIPLNCSQRSRNSLAADRIKDVETQACLSASMFTALNEQLSIQSRHSTISVRPYDNSISTLQVCCEARNLLLGRPSLAKSWLAHKLM